MMHHRTNAIDADLRVLGFAIPQPPVQPLHLLDDHRLRRHPHRITGRQAARCLLEVLESHADMKPVENRQLADAGIGENAPEPRAPVGEGSQHRVLGSSDGVEALADQDFDVCIGFGNGTENLPATRLRFDVTDPHFQMPLAVLTAANERRVQAHPDRCHRHVWPGHDIIPERRADLQGMPAHSLRILSGINRKHLLQHVSGHPVRHQGRKMRLKLVEFRRRPAMRWPTNASLDRATPSTAKTGKTHRDLAKMRRDRMVPVVLQLTNATTASALWPLNRVAPGLGGNDLLLEACQYLLPVGHGQTQIGDIVKTIRSVDRHDVGKRLVTVSPDLHQPHNPSHASTPGQITDAKIPLWPSHPQSCGGPDRMGTVRPYVATATTVDSACDLTQVPGTFREHRRLRWLSTFSSRPPRDRSARPR